MGPCGLVAERGGVQAGVEQPVRSGQAAPKLTGQCNSGTGGISQSGRREVMVVQPCAEPIEHEIIGIDAASARGAHQVADELHDRVLVFLRPCHEVKGARAVTCRACLLGHDLRPVTDATSASSTGRASTASAVSTRRAAA